MVLEMWWGRDPRGPWEISVPMEAGRGSGSAGPHEPVDDGLGDPPPLLDPGEVRGRDSGGEGGAVDEGHDGETTGVERGAQNVLAFAQGPVDALGPGAHVVALGTQTRLKRQRPRRDQCRDDSEVAERTLLLQALQAVGEEGCQAASSTASRSRAWSSHCSASTAVNRSGLPEKW